MSLPIPPGQLTPDNREYFDGLEQGRLVLPRCARCGEVIWYPRHHCPFCGSGEVSWFEATGRGSIYSFSVIRRGQGAYADAGPYVLAYVELEEGPRLMTNLLVEDFTSLAIGQPVEMLIERSADEPPLLRFRPLQ